MTDQKRTAALDAFHRYADKFCSMGYDPTDDVRIIRAALHPFPVPSAESLNQTIAQMVVQRDRLIKALKNYSEGRVRHDADQPDELHPNEAKKIANRAMNEFPNPEECSEFFTATQASTAMGVENERLHKTIQGLCANVLVLINVIKDPKGGSEIAKKIILLTAQDTVDEALAAHGEGKSPC